MRELGEALSTTAISEAIQSAFWFIRLLQATHLVTAGIVTASGVFIALRVLGWHRRDQPFGAVWRRFAPWLAGGFVVMALTGVAQTLGDPVREFTATSYWVKLALVAACCAGTAGLASIGRRLPPTAVFPLTARVVATALLVGWLAVPLLGRMIAYDRAIWGQFSLRT